MNNIHSSSNLQLRANYYYSYETFRHIIRPYILKIFVFLKKLILLQNLLHNYDRGRRTDEVERDRDVKKIRDLQRAMQVCRDNAIRISSKILVNQLYVL
jgi:hypothetical protein